MATEQPTLSAEGREAVRQLFDLAVVRLSERGIAMEFDPAAVDWVLGQSDWQGSLNPLRTLDGV